MDKKKLLKWVLIVGVIILISLSLGTIGSMYKKVNAFDQVFTSNVYIEDLAVGGLTKEEAKAKLEQAMSDKISKQFLVFTKGEISVEVPFNDLGITYNIDEIIDSAFSVGHDESFLKKYQLSKDGLEEAKIFELTQKIDEEKVGTQLETYSDRFYSEPINAVLERKNKQFIITKEINGEEVNIKATQEKALELLNSSEKEKLEKVQVEVVTEVIIPECTEETLKESQTLLASFSTAYNNANANRNANLKVAAEKITQMLLPDEIFYLSNQLEPFTEEAGYKSAGTIVNGKIEDSLGGGICQVGTTLYNAVLLTEIDVVMRQNHSLPVAYVPLGRDATYNTGTIDFQFKNNTGYPLFIEGYCENNQVIVNIYGHQSFKSGYEYKFESEVTEVIPAPATKYEDDPTLEQGKEIVEVAALDGKRVNLYKLYYKNGVLEKRVLINKSYYKPRAAVIKRGTKAKVEPVVPDQNETILPNNGSTNTIEPSSIDVNNSTSPNSTEQSESTEIANNDFAIIQE